MRFDFPWRRVLPFLLLLGLYLTTRGYHSRDGDQAYRLPLLLDRQDVAAFRDDPFIRAFDAFNPHRGYLALLDAASRPLGLSMALFGLFVGTFAAMTIGIDRLARSCWPDEPREAIGPVAVALVLLAEAGNIGTNHLFEPQLLDRLIALGLGWVALGVTVARPGRGVWAAPVALLAASAIHPSLGLQLGMLLGTSWVVWTLPIGAGRVGWRQSLAALVGIGIAAAPSLSLMATAGPVLMEGLPPDEFRQLALFVQGPQHMIPHLWRTPQWLAWGCFPLLALLSIVQSPKPAARSRLAVVLGVNLAALFAAWVAVEIVGDLRITLFQPFRLATVARGICLVFLSGRMLDLWRDGSFGRWRVALLAVGLTGDWTLVAATLVEVAATTGSARDRRLGAIASGWMFVACLIFLARHDTESGHLRLGVATAATVAAHWIGRGWPSWTTARLARLAVMAWLVPIAAMLAPLGLDGRTGHGPAVLEWLVRHDRFAALPIDDGERLAVWCREHTPEHARFVGPPGPKGFRLWSGRSLAFNRAGSPYHAAGLADWAERFRDHVGFDGTTAEFAAAYVADRQELERRYDLQDDSTLAELARRQGASYVIASSRRMEKNGRASTEVGAGPLECVHVEGRYAVFRVRPSATQARTGVGSGESAGTG